MAASRPAFHYALVASIALHALLLFVFPDWIDTARRVVELPAPIIARLLEPEPEPKPKPQPQPPAVPAPPVAAKPKPAARAAPEPPPVAAPAPIPAPKVEPAPAPPAPPPVAAVPTAPSPVPAPPAAAPPKTEDTTAQTADQYRLQLIDAARRIKDRTRYPAQAWENHWEGDVVLAIALRPDGKHSVAVNRSSRYEVLDQQAQQILSQALREVPLPAALRGKGLALREITVQYRQRD